MYRLDNVVEVHPDENDAAFIDSFRDFLERVFEATFLEPTVVGPVGSQVITLVPFLIQEEELGLVIETYKGISLAGPPWLVNEVLGRFKPPV
ncbi:MAG: hypothetical protein ABIT01_18560 [Thermoanaerobaculia bacterium]